LIFWVYQLLYCYQAPVVPIAIGTHLYRITLFN